MVPNIPKGLALNRTNNRTLRGAYGDDTAGWPGKLIIVFQTMADYRGRLVPALRVRIPPPKQASGNGQMSKPPPAPQTPLAVAVAAGPVPELELEGDDFDDEIPL